MLAQYLSEICRIPYDYSFLLTFLVGAVYYSLANSVFTSGQTIGKRVFRISLISRKQSRFSPFATVGECFFRYFVLFGYLILLTEIPPLIFRAVHLRGSSSLLELHILAAMTINFASWSLGLFDIAHRTLHDRFASTVVVRSNDSLPPTADRKAELARFLCSFTGRLTARLRSPVVSIALGLIIGLLLWTLALLRPAEVSHVLRVRYQLENDIPIRISAVSIRDQRVTIEAVFLNPDQDLSLLGSQITKWLRQSGAIESAPARKIEFEFSRPHDTRTVMWLVDTQSFEASTDAAK